MQWLVRREHSQQELSLKLKREGCDSKTVEALIASLQSSGAQSDRRYTEMYVRSRAGRGYGPVRIGHELKQSGVDDALIAEILYEDQIDWFVAATRVRHKKFGNSLPEDHVAEAKQKAFLQYRGFSFEHINESFNAIVE